MTMVTGLTIEEFLDGDFPRESELIHGKVVVTDPTFEHQRVCGCFVLKLAEWIAGPNGSGHHGFGGNWTVAPGQVLKPDVWWSQHRPTGIRSDRPPDLVIEVRSPSNWHYDRRVKFRVYESVGVSELWLVDPPGGVVLAFRRSAPGVATFDVALELAEADSLSSPLLPGFTLPVASILEAAC
jgi:Uma2 family endonuclease